MEKRSGRATWPGHGLGNGSHEELTLEQARHGSRKCPGSGFICELCVEETVQRDTGHSHVLEGQP